MMFRRLGAAIIGMGAPADIGEQAGRLPIARLVLGLVDTEGGEGLACPVGEFLGVGHASGRAAAQAPRPPRSADRPRCSSGDNSE